MKVNSVYLLLFFFTKKSKPFPGTDGNWGLWDKFSFYSRYLEKAKETSVRLSSVQLSTVQQLSIPTALQSAQLSMQLAVQVWLDSTVFSVLLSLRLRGPGQLYF